MKTNHSPANFILSTRVCALLAVSIGLSLAGCGDSSPATPSAQANPNVNAAEAPLAAAKSEPTAEKILPPASVRDAAATLDLSQVSLLPNAEKPSDRNVTNLTYRAPGKPDDAYKLHRDQLAAGGWEELPGKSVTAEYASAVFTKGGMRISLTAMPEKAGSVSVMLIHHGNVRFERLPVPAGSKVTYAGPSTAIFTSELPVESAANETAAALKNAGWESLGAAAPTQWFKQNAVKLSVMTSAAPGQGGKTTINFTSEMLPFDVAVPPSASNVKFSTRPKLLSFETSAGVEEVLAFYKEALPKLGWELPAEMPARIDANRAVVFHNAAKDILRLGARPDGDGKLKVTAEYRTGAEIAEMRSKIDAHLEAAKKTGQ